METDLLLRSLLALVFVGALIAVCAILAKKFALKHLMPRNKGEKRLHIEEVAMLDTKRRLMLVRRDDKEHLILLGQSDIVIETNIPAKEKA